MKSILAVLVMMTVAFSAFGEDAKSPMKDSRGDGYVKDEIRKILQEESDTAVSDLTFGEIQRLMGELSVPMQKEAYIQKSMAASWMLPGKGQFMNGDALSGALFLTSDVIVAVGTVVGGYFLLPADLRFSNLDYLNTSFADIKSRWVNAFDSWTLAEALPLIGVMVGGTTLHQIIAGISAKQAGRLAKQRIDEGIVTFEPMVLPGPHHKFGFGGRMSY